LDRVHFLHITTNLGAPFPNIQTTLLDTRLLENESGQTFVGAAGAFDLDEELATLRLDPEGIRIGYNGHIYISDEYGPFVFEFNRHGRGLRRLALPSKFFIAKPSSDPNAELLNNTSGRQANRGMEGLAISLDGSLFWSCNRTVSLSDATWQ
jgi:hypothetical protein